MYVQRLDNVGGTTVVTTVRQIDVVGQSAILDPTVFEPRKTYAIMFVGVVNRPMAMLGDYATVSPTYEQVTSSSHTFAVNPDP